MSRGSRSLLLAAALAVLTGAAVVTQAVGHGASARQARGCASHHSSRRDPSNPLDLPRAPGSDPLRGAHFFVDGPRHGQAAGAIAQLLGINPTRYPDNYSWARFKRDLEHGRLARKFAGRPYLSYQVQELEKIAGQSEAQRFSIYSAGGGPGKIFQQVQKMFCSKLTADPGSIPIVTTAFVRPVVHNCPSSGEIQAAYPELRRRIGELVAGTGNHPVVYLLDIDGYGSSSCMFRNGTLGDYEALLRTEVDMMTAIPHAVVYLEAGYSDSNSAAYTARALNNTDIGRIRGFFTNDTHFQWTINEVRWATRIARATHGAHFIVNTAQNGSGPKLNPHPVTQGIEELCNPPGRAIGPRGTTKTGFRYADAFLWAVVPGGSSGDCGRGDPPGSTFWPARAVAMASRANERLGPGWPSRPY
jgi:Glycosyl hydrolases family 6